MFSPRNLTTKLVVTATTLAVLAGSASIVQAASAPTVSAPKVYNAGQKTPVEVAGNDLAAGDTIRKGTKLLRWKVTLNGKNNQPITLRAPDGYKHVGLAINNGRQISFAVAKGSTYYKSTIKVRVYTLKGADVNTASGHIYALVKKSALVK
jgi:Flp pilus assembly protein CpaB